MDEKKLIESVISHLAENDSLSLIVSKLQVLAKLLKNDDLKSWIESEFVYGYKNIEEVPDYRNVSVSNVKATFLYHQGFGSMMKYSNSDLPISNLGKEHYSDLMNMKIRDTVFAIEVILSDNKGNIHYGLTADEKALIQKEILDDCDIINIYKEVSRTCFLEIINTTKAKLLDFFLELNESVFNNELNFDVMEKKDKISKVVNKTIYTGLYFEQNSSANFENSNIVGGVRNTVNFDNDFKAQVIELLNKVEDLSADVEKDRDDIAFEISQIKLALEKEESPKLIKSAFNAIKGITAGIVENVAANEITDLLDKTLPHIKF